jgi:hypothetical protein
LEAGDGVLTSYLPSVPCPAADLARGLHAAPTSSLKAWPSPVKCGFVKQGSRRQEAQPGFVNSEGLCLAEVVLLRHTYVYSTCVRMACMGVGGGGLAAVSFEGVVEVMTWDTRWA